MREFKNRVIKHVKVHIVIIVIRTISNTIRIIRGMRGLMGVRIRDIIRRGKRSLKCRFCTPIITYSLPDMFGERPFGHKR